MIADMLLSFTAGTHTTATTLEVIIYLLCKYPNVQERVYKELKEFEVKTREKGDFVIHCHRNQPQIVLANSEGEGRLKLFSLNIEK